MLREIQQVLRLVMLLEKRKQPRGSKTAGGLLVLLWTETEAPVQSMNCTVAAAGPWCTGIEMKALQPVLTDLKESVLACTQSCPQPDPEELCAFTDMHGSLRLLLSFQMKDARLFGPECAARIEAFLHSFSLANARIKIHFKFKSSQQSFQRNFRVKMERKVACPNRPPLILDVTCKSQPPECVKKGCWCHGGHPVLGGRLPLSIPPEAMDHGLFGELSVQPVTVLSPCVLQYPNLATQLTDIQVLVCAPSNVPITGASTVLQNLAAHLDCQELGLHGLRCSSFKADLVQSSGAVYIVEQEHCEDPEPDSSLPLRQQSLLLYLFLQHSDPFSYQLSDMMATEVLIEHHLEAILNNNRQAVTAAVQAELKNSLKSQKHRKKVQETLRSASEVILSSAISIVSCSSNMVFRNACLNRMKVRDTHKLAASLCESLRRVTSWKFTPRGSCYSAQMEDHPGGDESTRTEI